MANQKTQPKLNLNLRSVIVEFAESKGEIDVLTNEISDVKAARSQHLLQVAQKMGNVEAFLAACEVAENDLKENGYEITVKDSQSGETAKKRVKLDKMPRSWIQAKSNIKAAFSFDGKEIPDSEGEVFSIADCATESEMRETLNTFRKAQKAQSDGTVGESQTIDKDLEADVQMLFRTIHLLTKEDKASGVAKAREVVKHATDEIREMLKAIMPEGAPVKSSEAAVPAQATQN
jgi:hypothetical protein